MSRATNQAIAEGFSKGLQNFVSGYTERTNDQKQLKALDNPQLTPVQRASIISKMSKKAQQSYITTQLLENKLQRNNESLQRREEDLLFKNKRENRLQKSQDIKNIGLLYKTKISDLNEQVKNTNLIKDKKPILEEISKLQNEFATNANRVQKGKKPEFKYLKLAESSQPQEVAPTIQNQQIPQTNISGPQTFPTKIKWNPSDPLQKQRAMKVLQEANGDMKSANNVLAQEFEM